MRVADSIVVVGEGPTAVLLHGGPGLSDYMGMLDGWRRVRYQRWAEGSTRYGPSSPCPDGPTSRRL